DELPHLPHDPRRRDDHSGDQGDRHVDGERLARDRVNELAAGRKNPADRPEDEVDDRIDPRERDDDADTDANRRSNEALAEFVELFENRELEAGRALGIVGPEPAYGQRQSITPTSILDEEYVRSGFSRTRRRSA